MRKHQWLIIVALIGCLVSFTGCQRLKKILEPALEMPDETLVGPADVLIYIGYAHWISIENAAVEAETTQSLLQTAGIPTEITEDADYVRQWMLQTTSDGSVNVLILYGVMPTTIYPSGNIKPNGSIAENWIETLDGNTFLNQADWFGYWGQGNTEGYLNDAGGLQNIMDIPGITMWGEDTPMAVTADGIALTPSLVDFQTDRPFHLDELQGQWFAEKIFASNTGDASATRADPVIVRDGDRGRLAIVHQTNHQDNPKGEVAAEIIINYLLVK